MNSEHVLRGETFFDFIKKLTEASVLVGAFLFLIGWSYQYGYYRAFGLSSDDPGLSFNTVLVHSIPVIQGTCFWVTGLLVMSLLVALGSFQRTERLFRQSAIVLPLIVLAGLTVSRYAIGIGRNNAYRDAYLTTSTLPYVTLEVATEPITAGCSFDESDYRLLMRSNGQVFVVLPIDTEQNKTAPNLRVCSFPESRVQAMRIQVGLRDR